jgi:hypothetical protein
MKYGKNNIVPKLLILPRFSFVLLISKCFLVMITDYLIMISILNDIIIDYLLINTTCQLSDVGMK